MSTAPNRGSPAGSGQRGLRPVVAYLPFVRRVAARLARRVPSHVGLDDLIGAGVVGLLEAMERYDPERVTDFESYAEFRVKGSILDELRRRDLMARDARLEAKRIERVIADLAQRLGRQPEEEELAHELGLSLAALRTKLGKVMPVRVVSLTDMYPENSGRNDDGPFEQAARAQTMERLVDAIGQLKERHQQVLHLYYREDLTLKQIGEVLSVSESRACQILSEVTLRLRAMLTETKG